MPRQKPRPPMSSPSGRGAADYFTLRALDEELILLRSSVEVYRKALELTRTRRAGGIVSDLDMAQAETVVSTAEA